jgi:hypothetical protein
MMWNVPSMYKSTPAKAIQPTQPEVPLAPVSGTVDGAAGRWDIVALLQ